MRTTRWAMTIAATTVLAVTAGCGDGSGSPTSPPTGTAATTGAATGATTGATPSGRALPTGEVTSEASSSEGSTGTTGATSPPVLTWTGLAGVPLGADATAFAAALRQRLGPLTDTDRQLLAEHQCVYRRMTGTPGLALRVTGADPQGPVRVISLTEGSRIPTSAGIAVGDTLDEARRAYGAYVLDERFDHYPSGGSALTARASGGARWVFIADGRDVLVEIRLGRTPQVYDPEGCV